MTVPPGSRRCSSLFSAAGFIATSTLGASPGVVISWSEMWIWNAETPARDPAGARISAGNSGSVARSFPTNALTDVKRSPVSCMPSPESPAKRMITRSRSTASRVRSAVSDTVVLFLLGAVARMLSRPVGHITARAREFPPRCRVREDGRMDSATNSAMRQKMRTGHGFIAALDQSGGSSPKALELYGIEQSEYSNESEMFDLIHEMRTRIITSPSFTGDRVIGTILFEQTMDRDIEGKGSADYLWQVKQVVPFLKIDKGLADEADGVQVMKPMPGLDELLARGRDKNVFGTKERSVIKSANEGGIESIVAQQFEVGRQVLGAGLMSILEPEVDIKAPDKQKCEELLKASILRHLEDLDEQVMFKLTLPSQDGFYTDLVKHPKVLRVVALSGGYSRDEANAKLARNPGVIASFSRALTEGLTAQQSDAEFDELLDSAIKSIYEASLT